jgi:flagellar hook protein FlgE
MDSWPGSFLWLVESQGEVEMSFALSAGVSGLQAHQKMLDIAGNNLANVNTTAFKASRITFSELLSDTIRKASQPTANVGGTNPQQMGSGVGVSNITPNMTQGNIVSTGNPLDLAIEGEGYFVVSGGQQMLYTRAGGFAVDADSILVDPSTGFRVQRIGSAGEADGFQIPGDSNVRIPYDVAMPAQQTENMVLAGNLSADATFDTAQTNVIASNIAYTDGGALATKGTFIKDLDQFSGTIGGGETGTITVIGFDADGGALAPAVNFDVDNNTTFDQFITYLNDTVFTGISDTCTADLVNGKIVITDNDAGYSKTDLKMTYTPSLSGDDALDVPGYFEVTTVGGEEVRSVNITIFDSQGGRHSFTGAFVRTDTNNTWDMVLTAVSGEVYEIAMDDRRISGIMFNADGSYDGCTGDTEFVITFAHDPTSPQTIELEFGTEGKWDGLTQFKGNSTAVAKEQDGYEAGKLSSVSVNNEGIVIGSFSNGEKKDIATLQIALFQNTSGLESAGNGYFLPSANSGEPVATQALSGGAGSIHGGALEKSNADVASEFVNMIQAQNGFQANAGTIKIANEMLKALTDLIR